MLEQVNDEGLYIDELDKRDDETMDSCIVENYKVLQDICKTMNTLRSQVDKLHGKKLPDGESLLDWETQWKLNKFQYLTTYNG